MKTYVVDDKTLVVCCDGAGVISVLDFDTYRDAVTYVKHAEGHADAVIVAKREHKKERVKK